MKRILIIGLVGVRRHHQHPRGVPQRWRNPEMTITPTEIEEWQRLCGSATLGPWVARYTGQRVESDAGQIADVSLSDFDAFFIAAARTALPRLIEEVERLTRELADAALSARGEAMLADSALSRTKMAEAERDTAIAERDESRREVEHLTRLNAAFRADMDTAEEQLARLREAIKPFAHWPDGFPIEESFDDTDDPFLMSGITIANFRAARAALKENEHGKTGDQK